MRKITTSVAFAGSILLVAAQAFAVELLVIPITPDADSPVDLITQEIGLLLPAVRATRDAAARLSAYPLPPKAESYRQAALGCLLQSAAYGDAAVAALSNAKVEWSKLEDTHPCDRERIQYHRDRFRGYCNAAYGLYQGARSLSENAQINAAAAGLGPVVAPALEKVREAGKLFPEIIGFVVDPVML